MTFGKKYERVKERRATKRGKLLDEKQPVDKSRGKKSFEEI